MLGALFAAGFGPDALERYTWDQLGLMGECIGMHHIGMMEAVLRPLLGASGAGYSPGRVQRGKARGPTKLDHTDLAAVKRAKARDAKILLHAPGFRGVKLDL